MGEQDPRVVGPAQGRDLGVAPLELGEPPLVLQLGERVGEREARVGGVARVRREEPLGGVGRGEVAPADQGLLRQRGHPAPVGAHGDVLREGAPLAVELGARLLAGLLAGGAHVVDALKEEAVALVDRGRLRGRAHANGVVAARVQRKRLVKEVLAALDEPGGLLVGGKGKLVVNDFRGENHEVEGPVGVGLREGVAVLREAAAKARERARRRGRVALVELAGEAQAEPLVVLALWVVRHR